MTTLPAEWVEATLGDVCSHPQYGWTTSAAQSGDLRFLRTTDITPGRIDWATVPYCSQAPSDANPYLLADGDIVISRAGSVGKSLLIRSPSRSIFASYLIRLRPKVDADYIAYFLQSSGYWKQITEHTAGIAIPNINGSKLQHVDLPVAPINEQRRIVSKVDELFSRIDEGEQALKRVEKLVERYRQSVLKAAVTGELTRDWRAARKRAGGPVESGEALLTRILKARRAAWEAAELAKLKAKGKPPADDRWKQKYKEPQPPDTTNLPELPEGWVWTSLDTIADVTGGITVDAKRSAEGCELVPYLRVANVQRGFLDLTEVKSLLAPTDRIRALKLQAGDVLFNEGGDLDKLGRGWVWEDQVPVCIHQNHVFRARLVIRGSWPKLVSWYANEMGRSFFLDKGKQTTNLASISLTKLKALPIPMMGEAEAAEIENRVSATMATVEHEISGFKGAGASAAALRQSILKAAFSGQLVPQDPNDEPASKLLERILAERAAAPARSGRRGRRKADA